MTFPQVSWGKQTWLKHIYRFIVYSMQQGGGRDPGVGQLIDKSVSVVPTGTEIWAY